MPQLKRRVLRPRLEVSALDTKIVKKIQEIHGCSMKDAWFKHHMNMADYPVMKAS